LAYSEAGLSQNLVFPAVQFPSSASSTMTGWTAGGGIEYAFAGNWSAKVEGIFYNLGTIATSAVAVPTMRSSGRRRPRLTRSI
jgi:opacity protein-like surface antigen